MCCSQISLDAVVTAAQKFQVMRHGSITALCLGWMLWWGQTVWTDVSRQCCYRQYHCLEWGKTDSSADTLHLQVCACYSLSSLSTLHLHIKALYSHSSFKGIMKLIFKKGQTAVFSDYSRSLEETQQRCHHHYWKQSMTETGEGKQWRSHPSLVRRAVRAAQSLAAPSTAHRVKTNLLQWRPNEWLPFLCWSFIRTFLVKNLSLWKAWSPWSRWSVHFQFHHPSSFCCACTQDKQQHDLSQFGSSWQAKDTFQQTWPDIKS